MKILMALHGYPPELVGGSESAVRALAHGLVARGHEVVVVAGSLRHEQGFRRSLELDAAPGGTIRVHRIHRADLYFDHWQKGASARASLAFRDVLREERPDLVHVHHWIRLSRDLVHRAALERIPAVVTLHDLWTTCLVTFRVRPESGEFCDAKLAPSPCLACAAQVPPRTPWLSFEAQGVALLERSADLVRELELARAVTCPTRAHAEAISRYLALAPGRVEPTVVRNGRERLPHARTPLAPPRAGEPLVLGAWGHLHRLKGADRLLRALRRLPEPRRVRVHLAGGEPDAAYARFVHQLAEGLDVHFHGPYSADDLHQHPVSAVHAFVSGTLAHESWGLVLDEAVALGLPCILPESGAYAERMRAGEGALFYAPGDDASLARTLAELLERPARLAELRARLPAVASFAPRVEDLIDEWIRLYTQAHARGAPGDVRAVPERERIWQAQEDAWGAALQKRSAEELGFA